MNDLLKFLIRYSAWALFAIYVTLSCVMLFSSNPYQHHVWLTSANAFNSAIYRSASSVTSYFSLRHINDDLQRRNADLQLELLDLKAQLRAAAEAQYADTATSHPALSRYNFTVAHVINNSTSHTHNYITLSKGTADGIHPEQGVVDQNGIVGIVNLVTPHTARVISVLNPYLRISCKVKGQDHVGSLSWDGISPQQAILEELPRHARFNIGDTIITSGYSSVFPEGIPIGTVIQATRTHDDNFHTLRVNLFTDFHTLSTVRVITDSLRQELNTVERDIKIKTTL